MAIAARMPLTATSVMPSAPVVNGSKSALAMRSAGPSLALPHATTTQRRTEPDRTRASPRMKAVAPSSPSRVSSLRYVPAAGAVTMLVKPRPSTRSCAASTTASTSATDVAASAWTALTHSKIRSVRLERSSAQEKLLAAPLTYTDCIDCHPVVYGHILFTDTSAAGSLTNALSASLSTG